jgi:predicted nuclease of predicted toxin-antitoxin system
MRVLLDEQLPRKLARDLVGHEVDTVQQKGWAGLRNGDLLKAAAEAGLEVFVTKDQSLEFQQNLKNSGIAVIVLVAPSHDIEVLRPLVPAVMAAIEGILPGEVRRVTATPGD